METKDWILENIELSHSQLERLDTIYKNYLLDCARKLEVPLTKRTFSRSLRLHFAPLQKQNKIRYVNSKGLVVKGVKLNYRLEKNNEKIKNFTVGSPH